MGAGVAGLQAIATAKRLGARRRGLRRAARGEGAGAEPRRQVHRGARHRGAAARPRAATRKELTRGVPRSASASWCASASPHADVVITTALIPGKAGAEAGHRRHGRRRCGRARSSSTSPSSSGGNCELTERGQVVVKHGVTIIGTANVPGLVPVPRQRDVRAQHPEPRSATCRQGGRCSASTSRTRSSRGCAASPTRARSVTSPRPKPSSCEEAESEGDA